MPEEHLKMLEDFIHDSLEMVKRANPLVCALVAEPDREDILPEVIGSCSCLFHSIKGTGNFLHLDNLVGPAQAMDYMLDRIGCGELSVTAEHVSLLAESCRFMEQGLSLSLTEKSDERLASSASLLTSAILQSINDSNETSCDGRDVSSDLPEIRDTFLWETEKLLTTAEQEFVLWDFIAVDRQRVADLGWVLHRLSENFAFFELTDMESLCLALETTLARYLQGDFFQTGYPERVFLRSIDAVRSALESFSATDDAGVPRLEHHLSELQGLMRQPIGSLLVDAGLVNSQTVEKALGLQKISQDEKKRRLGEILVDMGEVTQDQVQRAVQEQQVKQMSDQAKTEPGSIIQSSISSIATTVSGHDALYTDGKKPDGRSS